MIWTAALALTTWTFDLYAAERRIESAEELVTLILDEWQRAEAQAEKNKGQPGWKQRQNISAHISNLDFPGPWLIEALEDSRLGNVRVIRISDCRITGGLNFQLIPETPLDSVDLPAHWSAVQRQTWLASAKASDIAGLHVVEPGLRFERTTFDWRRGQFLTFNARRTLFRGNLELSDVTIGRDFSYGEKNFHNAIFAGDVEFDGVKWSEQWDMSGAVAVRPFHFSRIDGDVLFENMRFESDASFSDMRAGANFTDAVFEGEASFSGIDALLNLRSTRFRGPALLSGGSFHGNVDMTGAVFEELVSFQDSRFLEVLKLSSITAKGFLDFRNSTVRQLDFRNSTLNLVEGRADFRNARIENLCVQDVVFANDVDFSDATLGKEADSSADSVASETNQAVGTAATTGSGTGDQSGCGPPSLTSFRFVTFEGNAYFLRTDILGHLHLADVGFNQAADFTAATLPRQGRSSPHFLFSFVRFSDLLIRWRQLPPISQWINPLFVASDQSQDQDARVEPLSRVMHRLEASFRSRNLLADANEARYNAKLAELAEARRYRDLDERLAIEAEWLFWGLSSGYGTRTWPILGGAFAVCLVFAFLYTLCSLERRSLPKSTGEFSLRLRLLELPHQYLGDTEESSSSGSRANNRFITALRLSALLLFKIGYRDTVVSGKLGFLHVRYIVMIEWVLGFYFLGCITVTLANTQPLINKLISGVF